MTLRSGHRTQTHKGMLRYGAGRPARLRPGEHAALVALAQYGNYSVAAICRAWGMPRTTYYDYINRPVQA